MCYIGIMKLIGNASKQMGLQLGCKMCLESQKGLQTEIGRGHISQNRGVMHLPSWFINSSVNSSTIFSVEICHVLSKEGSLCESTARWEIAVRILPYWVFILQLSCFCSFIFDMTSMWNHQLALQLSCASPPPQTTENPTCFFSFLCSEIMGRVLC